LGLNIEQALMKPKLRYLEFSPLQHDGREYFHVSDRHGFAPSLLVPRAWGGLLAMLDGTRDVGELISHYSRQCGEDVERAGVESIIAQLDEALLLESANFYRHRSEVIQEFEAAHVRAPSCAGGAYPAEPDALRIQLQEYFDAAAAIETPRIPQAKTLRGIVVPHIDFGRGGVTEALAYQHLREADFDTFIVLGIAHNGVAYPFCAADKDFETPLGTALCDRELLADLDARNEGKMLREQYAHKHEHSIEFVAVFLQYLEPFKNSKIVPILCGGFFEELKSGASPSSTPVIAQFIETLRDVVQEHTAVGKKIGLIASVDLAHVGSNFGDDRALTPSRLQQIETSDREFLRRVEAGDLEGIHAALARDNNVRNVDAHPAVYSLMSAFPELRATLLQYQQAFNEKANSVVSFAALRLWS
jgi:AmmeMemoRadiSam system protein B